MQALERWEYQVIHLNVAGPNPAQPQPPGTPPSQPPAAGPPAQPPDAVFSRQYLEKEFPAFYGGPSAAGGDPQGHPALQLRGFLNGQGQEGWLLLGIFPVGQLLMMVFRRPLADGARPPDAAAGPGRAAAEAPVAAQPQTALADERSILARLEALERRLAPAPTPASEASDGVSPAAATLPELAELRDGEILAEVHCRQLAERGSLSSAEAARALGFRSAASLLNQAARCGYPPGLIKRGANDLIAVYIGSEKSDRGGRDRRLWVVLNPPQSLG
ncbi:MAG: hypothetical protein WAM11_13060 [Cyanobium sp.]